MEFLRELGAWPDPAAEVTVPQHVLHLDLSCAASSIPTETAHRLLSAVAVRSQDFLPTGELATGRSGLLLLEGLVSDKHEE